MAGKEEKTGKAVLIYDSDCPVCRKTVKWIRENEYKNSFEMLPCRSEEVTQRFPFIDKAVCMKAMQLILPGGRVLSGEKALPEILKRLRRYRPASHFFRLPGSGVLSRYLYRKFADNRYHIANVLFAGKGSKRKDREK